MKYKVALIDDEPIIRKGLKNIIDWEQFNCEVVAEARDGFEGLKAIETHSPDIVFTDIKMPEMTGLEMLSELSDSQRNAKYIVLTGFRDFEYVKEALILGAFDFLLKPTKLNDIKKVVGRAVAELDMQKNKNDVVSKLEARYRQNLPVLREKFLYDIMMGIVTNDEEIELSQAEMGLEISNFVMLVVSTAMSGEQAKNFGALHTFSEMLGEEYDIIPVAITNKKSAFIVKLPKDSELLYSKCLQLQSMMCESFGMCICIAVSEPASGINKILSCYTQCQKVERLMGVMGEDAFMLYSDIKGDAEKYNDDKLLSKGRIIVDTIKSGAQDAEEAWCITDLEADLRRRDSVGESERAIVLQIIDSMLTVAPKASTIDREKDVFGLIDEMRKIYKSTVAENVTASHSNMKLVLKKAVEFLELNYSRPLTLRQVADSVFVSPFYISRMFSRQLGKTMTEYLNGIRIKKACELLSDVEYKVYQVGEMVGIPDAHYFSRLFKKQVGVTPTEYRNSVSGGAD